MGRRGIPDRWLEYSPVGERIAGTSFIAFKVPLKENVIRGLPQQDRFTTQVLMKTVPNIGLVIDLTNTDRYYNSKDFLGQGILYEKIFCRGHEIPSQSVVDKFFSAVDQFHQTLQSGSTNQGVEKLIGVHCTHGLNRTGYLVCRYMIRRLGFSPEDAIRAFEKARGYPMEREGYLKDLRVNEDCSQATDSVNLNSHGVPDGNRNDQNSSFLHIGASSFPSFFQGTWTNNSPSHSRDVQTAGFANFSHEAAAYDFQRFRTKPRNDDFRSSCQSVRPSSFLWRSENGRADDFNNFTNSPRNSRAAFHPYRWEHGSSFDPEERVSHSSRAVSTRFHEQDYEANKVIRSHRYNYQDRSALPYIRDSGHTLPRGHHYTKDWQHGF